VLAHGRTHIDAHRSIHTLGSFKLGDTNAYEHGRGRGTFTWKRFGRQRLQKSAKRISSRHPIDSESMVIWAEEPARLGPSNNSSTSFEITFDRKPKCLVSGQSSTPTRHGRLVVCGSMRVSFSGWLDFTQARRSVDTRRDRTGTSRQRHPGRKRNNISQPHPASRRLTSLSRS